MAVDVKFLIDGADRGQPTNIEDFGVTVNENSEINMRIVSFDNDMKFTGGAYEYLYNNLVETGGCSLVNVEIQYQCAGVYKRLTNGYIIVSECTFLLDRCELSTKIYDNSFSSKINNNKSIPFPLNSIITKNLLPVSPPIYRKVDMYNPTTGIYLYSCYGVSIYDAFKHLVACMSDNFVDFDSDLFRFDYTEDGNFDLVTVGLSIFNASIVPTAVSFESLYNALNKKLRLGMVIETQANGRPLLRIEPATYFIQLGADVNLYNQPNIVLKYDKEQQYAAIDFGSNPYLEQHECSNGEASCTFFQDSFRGFKEETFGLLGECNTSKVLKLRSEDVVFDTNVIEDVYKYGSENFNNNVFIIQSAWDVALNKGLARKFDPYNIGQGVYNGDYTNEKTALNWVGGYPNGIYSYQQGFFPGSTQVQARSNASPLQEWELDANGAITSYFAPPLRPYVEFANVLIDPSSNFDNIIYTVPYTAVYDFSATVIASLQDADGFYAEIVRSNGVGVRLDSYTDFILVVPDPITFAAVCTVAWSTVCNEGDQVTVNIWGKIPDDLTAPPAEILNSYTDPVTSETYYTQFDAIGTPFPQVLQPVNPNDIIRLIYAFDRPLLMQEIEDILDNTSKPIKFGRWDDPLRVIEGYIKTVNVKSIIKQDASIELKSNKILR
jgi:hypothetical protein